jgi:hypothetical protein
MDERRHTLEALLQDEERSKRAQNLVPSWTELNRALARGDGEFELFEKLDRELKVGAVGDGRGGRVGGCGGRAGGWVGWWLGGWGSEWELGLGR